MAEIYVQGVSKVFHQQDMERMGFREMLNPSLAVTALDGANMTIRDGESMSVVGPSGCGKTTLLRVIAGLEQSDSGTIYYDGVDMKEVPPKDRGIGIVFQNYALYPHMTSLGNLSFFFRLRHREPEIPERVRITSEILGVGFDQLLDRKPKTLSGGEKQRVALGRCIVREPKLFLLDEPISNLDAKLRARTRAELKRLIDRFRITTLYVTHDQTEAIVLGTRIAIMREGRIEQIGTYHEIFYTPANAFVANFIGTPGMNLFPGRVVERTFHGDGFSLPLPRVPAGLSANQPVILGLRPEHFVISNFANCQLQAPVEVVQTLVSTRELLLNLFLGNASCVARVDWDNRVKVGDVLPLRVEDENIYLFDGESERRLL